MGPSADSSSLVVMDQPHHHGFETIAEAPVYPSLIAQRDGSMQGMKPPTHHPPLQHRRVAMTTESRIATVAGVLR